MFYTVKIYPMPVKISNQSKLYTKVIDWALKVCFWYRSDLLSAGDYFLVFFGYKKSYSSIYETNLPLAMSYVAF